MTQIASGAPGAVDEVVSNQAEQSAPQEIEAQPAEQIEAQVEAESSEDAEGQETEAEQGSRRPRRGGFQKKIERLAAENAALRAALVNNTGAPQAQTESVSAPQGRPDPESFKTYEDYVEALADWKVEQRMQQREAASKQETLQESYNRQIAEAQKAYSDFDEAIAEYDFHLMPRHAQEALLHSDMGAHIAYHIANNPEIGDAISRLSPVQAALKIGELGLQLRSQTPRAKAAPKFTKAPPPISPLKGTATSQRTLADYVAAGDHEGYAAARRAGLTR